MRISGRFVLVSVLALGGLPTLADEVIYFTNGSSMPIRSHVVEEGMIQVDLGGDNSMSFPMDQVERIEAATGQVFLSKGTRNQMVPSAPRGGEIISRSEVPGRFRRDDANDGQARVPVERDERGVPSMRPYAGSANAKRSEMRVTGNRSLFGGSANTGRPGTVGNGGRVVVPSASRAATSANTMKIQQLKGTESSRKKK